MKGMLPLDVVLKFQYQFINSANVGPSDPRAYITPILLLLYPSTTRNNNPNAMPAQDTGRRLKNRLLDIEEAIVAGLEDYRRLDRSFTSLTDRNRELEGQIEAIKTRNSNLELALRRLKYMILENPQGE